MGRTPSSAAVEVDFGFKKFSPMVDGGTSTRKRLIKSGGRGRPPYTESAIDVSRRIVQGNQLPWRIIFRGEWVFRIRVLYSQDLSAADSPENEILRVNGDNSVSFFEYRIVVHNR